MRKFIFATILCMFSMVSFAQQVTGKIVDEKGNPLQSVTIQVIGRDSLVGFSDDKGVFTLNCGKIEEQKAKLRISCLGYQPLDIAFDGNAENVKLGTLQMKRDSYNLQDVTITAAAKQQVDRTIHFPSIKMKESANDGYELINKMMLPGVVVNLAEKSLSMVNKQTVLLYINDKPASKSDVMSLRPTDVVKVEFIDAPGAEYGFDTNVGSVIKFFVKRHDAGYAVGVQTSNALTTRYGQNYVYGKYYKGMSEFAIAASNEYSSVHRRNTSEYNEYNLGDETHVIQRDGINTKLGYSSTNVDLTYNLTKPQKYILDFCVSGTFYDAPHRGNKQYVTETGKTPYYSFTKNTEHYFKPVFNLFHKVYLGSHQTLISNAVYTIIDTDYGYYLDEYTDEGLADKQTQYSYDTDGLKHSFIFETKYMNQFGGLKWVSGVRYAYGKVENKYKGYSSEVNRMTDDNAYLYTQLSGSLWKKLGFLAGIGASYQYAKQGEQKAENWILRPQVTLQVPIKKFFLRYTFQVYPIAPSLGNLSNTIQQANQYEYSQGNPELKMNSYFINRLTASASLGKLYMGNTVRYDYARHPMMSEISLTEIDGQKAFLHTVANQKSSTHLYDNFFVQYAVIKDMLTLQGNVSYHHYQSIADSYRHYLNDVNGMVQADMYVGKWSLGASWNSASKDLTGETISKSSSYSSVYVNYRLGQLRFGLMANYLFQKDGIVQPEKLINKNLKKSLTLRIPSMGNMVMFTLSWNFQKGKEHQAGENSFSNSDGDSGILKF